MKYYKILNENTFIGVVTNGNFVAENQRTGWLLTSNENLGQFVSYKGQLYRDYWMQPIHNSTREFMNVKIIEIDEEEYNVLLAAIEQDEEIIIDDDEEEEEPTPIIPPEDPDITTEFVREAKLKEMSNECKKSIENGFNIILSDGGTHHFSLTTQDQLNLMALQNAEGMIPYHADGEQTKFYPASDIHAIIDMASKHKTYHTTYYNSLKSYINSLSTMEEIAAITYGILIPNEYKTDVLKIIEVGHS